MNWQAIAAFAGVAMTFVGLNLGALKWLLDRHDAVGERNQHRTDANAAKIVEVEKDILRFRAELPIEYVRREDWIRFGNTLEAKMDAMRAEFREELAKIGTRAPGGSTANV